MCPVSDEGPRQKTVMTHCGIPDIWTGPICLDARLRQMISDADLITYTDTSLTGLRFYHSDTELGFCSSIPAPLPSDDHLLF